MLPPEWRSDLGGLADSALHTAPLEIAGEDHQELMRMLRAMLQIRLVEERVSDWIVAGVARTPCHLGIGQEAAAVGVCATLRPTDRVFGGHRSHSHFLALGGSPYSLLTEILGKLAGASRGMGGSMHLYGASFGFHGSVPLVGATIPIAVGAALAAQMDGNGDVAIAFFGDGACEEGVFHESLNLAAVYRLPILFVCENNLFSSHLDIQFRQPSDRMARYGAAHCIPSATVDGNDVLAVRTAAREMVDSARAGGGPGLLELVTFRIRGHVGANEDIDVGVHRRMEDVRAWKARCPIARMINALVASGAETQAALAELRASIATEVDDAASRADAAPYPDVSALDALVYAAGGTDSGQ
jgi:pyruvate dehydrogenase E1 component alpha subunit